MSNRHPYEVEAIEQVRSYLRVTRGIEYRITQEHVPVGNKNCDYLLTGVDDESSTIAVEIVRLVDSAEAMEQERWRSILWTALKTECAKRGISGFIVQTPWELKDPPREINRRLAPSIVDGVVERLRDNPDASNFTVKGFHFGREPGLEGIVALTTGGGRWLDTAGSSADILDTLEDKDAQLALPVAERFLVGVGVGLFLDANDIARELALREDLDRLHHVDLVLVPSNNDLFVVYARPVRDYFAGRVSFPEFHAELTNIWFCSRLGAHRQGAFELVKALREMKGLSGFLDVEVRVALAHHGTELVDRGRRQDAAWIVRELYVDPHPVSEASITKDAIATVRGATASLLQKVIAHTPAEEVSEFVEIARSLSSDTNFGVRRLAAHSLRMLLARRDAFTEKGPLLDEEVRLAIKRVWFEYIDTAKTLGLTDAARTTLDYLRDLTEVEAERVLAALSSGSNWDAERVFARFLIYFGFLRSSDPRIPQNFESARFRERMCELLREQVSLRVHVAFVFRDSVRNHPETQRVLEPLLMMLLNTSASDAQALKFTLDGAALLVSNTLLSSESLAAILRAMSTAGPFEEHEAHFVADGLRELTVALELRFPKTPNGSGSLS